MAIMRLRRCAKTALCLLAASTVFTSMTLLSSDLLRYAEKPRNQEFLSNQYDATNIVPISRKFPCRIPEKNLRDLSDELRGMSQDEFEERFKEVLRGAQKPLRIVYVASDTKTLENHNTSYCCGNCEITEDIHMVNDPNTKAVVVHYSKATEKFFQRHFAHRRDQYFVWQCREAPLMFEYRHMTFKGIDDVFNLSMTYRGNSDIWLPMGAGANSLDHLHLPLSDDKFNELIAKKNRLALWVVSNCAGRSGANKRMKYVKELLKHNLQIDLGGRCFHDRSKSFNNENYKFYFAFENSWNCSDYITEKFWRNALGFGTVPVVLGAVKSDYLKVAPHNSFIYAHDFKSPKELAEYLKYLDRNQTAYAEYLNWMKKPKKVSPTVNRERGVCQLCRVLHGINIDNLYQPNYLSRFRDIPMFGYPARPRIVPSISNWYLGEENQGCLDQRWENV